MHELEQAIIERKKQSLKGQAAHLIESLDDRIKSNESERKFLDAERKLVIETWDSGDLEKLQTLLHSRPAEKIRFSN